MRAASGRYLSSHQLEQCKVDRKHVNVCVDGRLVERAGLAVQLIQAGLADRVGAAKADGLVHRLVKLVVADRTGQELRPLGRLHGHRGRRAGARSNG